MSNAGFTANPTPDTQVEGPDGTVARSISDSDRDIGDADNSSITSDASTGEAITQVVPSTPRLHNLQYS